MDIKRIIDILSDPSTYPHDCTEITRIETHISVVFLTGEYAYKIKKSVDFGFLDFSTLERRRHFCQQELWRNAVFAPEIYIKVLALQELEGRFQLSDDLEGAKEYVLKMRQFPQEQLLSQQIAQGGFSVEQAFSLGRDLGRLHGRIEVAEYSKPWGSLDAVAYPIQENFAQIEPLLTDETDLEEVAEIKVWSVERLAELGRFITKRKQSGFIRACHGDLHLNNILWRFNKAVPFDCIEFNDEFHWIDVMSELAFLLMDFEHQKQPELANYCLNGYLEVTGDYAGLEILQFYKVYRAMVRAKVAILRLQQATLCDQEKVQVKIEYLSYISLAKSYIKQSKPCLYITHGVSGSGKTTMARFVAGKLSAVHIRSDVERKRLFGLKADESSQSQLDAGIYTKEATLQTFAHLEALSKSILASDYSVIVDATFLHQSTRQQFQSLAKKTAVPFAVLDCAIDEQTARNRLIARMESGNDASEADLKVLEKQLADQDFLSPEEQRYVVSIDMGKPLEDIDIERLIRCEAIAD